MNEFLKRYGWSVVGPVGQDGSPRRYFRAQKGGRTAVFMDASGGGTPGHRLEDFIRIGSWLREIGLGAPEIYEADEAAGYLLLEDFGDVSFKAALNSEGPQTLYGLAHDVLSHIQNQTCPPGLPDYYESHVHAGLRQFVDWYVPALGRDIEAGGFLETWKGIEEALPPCPQGFVHGDYHAENLMFLPDREGLKRCGILDFQGAMAGPAPYDLVNLLEDVRTDVPADIRQGILQDYDGTFRNWTRVLGTQFHCRVAGQFIRLAVEDNKTQYLEYLPRVTSLTKAGLEDPVLKPIARWFEDHNITFEKVPQIGLLARQAQAQG